MTPDLTAEEQARLLLGQIPGGVTLSPEPSWDISGQGGMQHWTPQVATPDPTDYSAPARALDLVDWLSGGQSYSRKYNPRTGQYEMVPNAPPTPPASSKPPKEAPKLNEAPGGGDSKAAPPPPPPPKENPDTPKSVSAYKTKDGKIFFTNQQAPEGATALNYNQGLDEVSKVPLTLGGGGPGFGKSSVGTAGGGGFVFAQESPEQQQLTSLRDALLKQRMAEAQMTPQDRLNLQINAQKQMSAAQTQNQLDELKKLSDMLMGTKLVDEPGETDVWDTIKRAFYKQLVDEQKKPGYSGPKLNDQQLWEQAHRMTAEAADRKYQEKILQMYMMRNGMRNPLDYAMMMNSNPGQ